MSAVTTRQGDLNDEQWARVVEVATTQGWLPF